MYEEISVKTDEMTVRFRNRDCKRAMKAYFSKVLAEAMSVGWTECEAAFYLAEVADDHIVKFCKKNAGARQSSTQPRID
jgi:hypothetical protein